MRLTCSISGKEISLKEMEKLPLINDWIADICNAVRRRVRNTCPDLISPAEKYTNGFVIGKMV